MVLNLDIHYMQQGNHTRQKFTMSSNKFTLQRSAGQEWIRGTEEVHGLQPGGIMTFEKSSYEKALESIAHLKTLKTLTEEEAFEILDFEDSYSRLYETLLLHGKMLHQDWCKVLAYVWSISDNISTHRHALKQLLGTVGPIKELMDDKELIAFDSLQDVVTIYRGCCKRNMVGASWSTDKNVAEKFPFLNRYRVKAPILVTGKVKKKNILAYKLDRNEFEIITFSARRTSIESLDITVF